MPPLQDDPILRSLTNVSDISFPFLSVEEQDIPPKRDPILQALTGSPPQQIDLESRLLQTQESLAGRSLSPKDFIARQAGRQPVDDAGNFFTKLLTEFVRPQKALFAGAYALRTGKGVAEAVRRTFDELNGLEHGFGRLKYDVQGSDLLDPFATPDERTFLKRASGFAIDLVLDPLVWGAKFRLITKLTGGHSTLDLTKGLAKLIGTGSTRIPVVGSKIDDIGKVIEKHFLTRALNKASDTREVGEVLRDARLGLAQIKNTIINIEGKNARKVREFAEEAGVPLERVDEFINHHLEKTKLEADNLFLVNDGQTQRILTQTEAERIGVDLSGRRPAGIRDIQDKVTEDVKRLTNIIEEHGNKELWRLEGLKQVTEEVITNNRALREAALKQSIRSFDEELLAQLGSKAENPLVKLIVDLKDNQLLSSIAEQEARLKAAGRGFGNFDALRLKLFESANIEYFHRAATEEAKEVLGRYAFRDAEKFGYAWSPNHAAELQRSFRDKTLTEINELARKASPKTPFKVKIDGRKIEITEPFTMFDTNPTLRGSVRQFYADRAVTIFNTFEKLTDNFGAVVTDPDFLKQIGGKKNLGKFLNEQGMRRLNLEAFENVALPNEIADLVETYWKASTDPDSVGKVLGTIGRINSIWKAYTIFPFLEYHTRNYWGNKWNMFLGGMGPRDLVSYHGLAAWALGDTVPSRGAKRLSQALSTLKGTKFKFQGDTVRLAGRDMTRADVLQLIDDMKVTASGQFGAGEITRSIRTTSRAARGELSTVEKLTTVEGNRFLRSGLNLAKVMEDTDRAAMALWAFDKGTDLSKLNAGAGAGVREILAKGTLTEADRMTAARNVAFNYLFDYDDLTQTERQIRRLVAPFYAWARKNIPLQLEHMVADPAKLTTLLKFKSAIESDVRAGKAPPDQFISEFIREGFNVRVRHNKEGEFEYFLFDNWIPSADLAEIGLGADSLEGFLDKNKDFFVNQLGPIPKTAIEQIANKLLFFERDFGERHRAFIGINMDDRTQSILRNVRVLSLIDRFTRTNKPGATEGEEAFLALLRTLTGLTVFPQDPRRGALRFRREREEELRELKQGAIGARRDPSLSDRLGLTDESNRLLRKALELGRERPQ